jgi:hypothetical protein
MPAIFVAALCFYRQSAAATSDKFMRNKCFKFGRGMERNTAAEEVGSQQWEVQS